MLFLMGFSALVSFSLVFAAFISLAMRVLYGRAPKFPLIAKYTAVAAVFAVALPIAGGVSLNTVFGSLKLLPLFFLFCLVPAIFQTGTLIVKDRVSDAKGNPSSPRRAYASVGSALAATVFTFLVIGLVTDFTEGGGVFASAPTQMAPQRVTCSVKDVRLEARTDLINNELDWGVEVSGTVANTGPAQYLAVSANLSTSEGEFKRRQRLRFEQGQARSMKFFIHEPTASAQNINGEMSCAVTE